MPKLTYVPVNEPEQIAELANLADAIWHEYFPCFLPPDEIDYLLDLMLSTEALTREIADEGYEFYFANHGGAHVGFIGVQPREDHLFLSKLYLVGEERGKGYGREEFEFVTRRARELGFDRIQLTCARENTASLELYDHMGFKTIDEVDADVGGGYFMRDYVMEYELAG